MKQPKLVLKYNSENVLHVRGRSITSSNNTIEAEEMFVLFGNVAKYSAESTSLQKSRQIFNNESKK